MELVKLVRLKIYKCSIVLDSQSLCSALNLPAIKHVNCPTNEMIESKVITLLAKTVKLYHKAGIRYQELILII